MTPEEEIANLKEQLHSISTSFVALTAHQYSMLYQKAENNAISVMLQIIADNCGIDGSKFQEAFTTAKDLSLDQELSKMTLKNPALAALLDDRNLEDVPTSPEDKGL